MKITSRIFQSVMLAAALLLSSCNKIEDQFTTAGKTPLDTPEVFVDETTTSSFSISWTKVENAGQYLYKVLNSDGYAISKGVTSDNYVTVKGLKYGTTYTVQVNAIPNGDAVATMCSSSPLEIKVKTEDPIIIDYVWQKEGKAWFYSGDSKWNTCNVTVGLENGTGNFIVTSWCGVEGFDLYFNVTSWDGSSFPVEFDDSMLVFEPVIGQAIDQDGALNGRGDLHLAHGMGGKTNSFVYWYGNGEGSSASYNKAVLDPTGGYIDFWCLDYNGDWCGYRIEYGEYTPAPPAPFVPDADADNSWEQATKAIFNEDVIGEAYVEFDAESGAYTISSWFGVEGYDVVLTRDAETGNWIIDEECSAYAGVNEDGKVGLYHGIGRAKYGICWVDGEDLSSGLSGDENNGFLFASITGPDGTEAEYRASWPLILTNGDLDYDWSREGVVVFGDELSAKATISYVAETKTYTISGWCGVEGYDIVFTRQLSGEWIFDREASSAYVRDGDYGDTGFNSGIDDAATAWIYESGSALEGDDKAGYAYTYGWSPYSKWTDYTLTWSDSDWTRTAHVSCPNPGLDFDTTISYEAASGKYTIANWFGTEGVDLVFTVAEAGNIIVDTTCTAYWDESADRWNLHAGEGVASIMFDEASSTFAGGMSGGSLTLGTPGWFWDSVNWGDYTLTW